MKRDAMDFPFNVNQTETTFHASNECRDKRFGMLKVF